MPTIFWHNLTEHGLLTDQTSIV